MSSVTPNFPPQVTLASTLNAANPSVLAAKAFADPNSGYAGNLRVASAVADNQAGRFNLVSGITVASNALNHAFGTLKDFQSSLTDLYSTVARLRDPALQDDIRVEAQREFSDLLDHLKDTLRQANADDFNLLDATNSDGVKLDLQSGAFTNVGKSPQPSSSGLDQRFAFSPDQLTFRAPDLAAAIDDLNSLVGQVFPDGPGHTETNSSFGAVSRLQDAIKGASTSLKAFQTDLEQVASSRLNGFDDDEGSSADIDAAQAQQIASRLAQALHNDSFNISASQSARFFSLFA
jgi:hypothetical protein